MLEFGEFLYTDVLKQVPHRQWVFSIPKRLRRYFMYDRSLLSKLSRCAWKVLALYLQPLGTSDVRLRSLLWLIQGVSLDDPKPGAVIAVQTFGDFLNFNPHLHIIASDGCFATDRGFMVGTEPDASSLIDLFRGEVFKMLAALCHPWHRCTSPSVDVATKNHDPPIISSADIEYACLQVPLSIANEENLSNLKST